MGIRSHWESACADNVGREEFWRIAVDHLSIERQLRPLIIRYATGRLLDAGAGKLAWRSILEQQASSYIATDYAATHPELAFRADLHGRLPLKDQSLDTIFCCSVLEHTTEPWRVLPEFFRILRPGGHAILSVPFLYYLHGAPRDYFRFTRYGIVSLAETAGFEIIELKVGGGIAHALCHVVSMAATALLWNRRCPWLVTMQARALFAFARLADRLDRRGLFAQTVNVILRRP